MNVKDDFHSAITLEQIQVFGGRNNSLKRVKTNISWSFLFWKSGSEILVLKLILSCKILKSALQKELKKHHYAVRNQKIRREIILTSEPWSRLI